MLNHRQLRIAIVGYGYWGSKHVRVFFSTPNVSVTVVDENLVRLTEARKTFPSVSVAQSLDAVLDKVDAVVVATPPEWHAPVALQAIAAGKHVLVEKPLATSSVEADMMVRAAADNNVCLMVGHTFEYNAAVWKLKEIIESGELGRVHYIHTARLGLGRYQRDCNVIWDLAPHDISIVSYLLDEMPRQTAAWAQCYVGERSDVAMLRMDFSQTGVHAFVHVSWLHPRKVRQVTVVGERKMAVYDDLSDERIRIYDVGVDPILVDSADKHTMPVTYRSGDIVSPYVNFVEPLQVQANHFVECVLTGRRPNTSGERGLDVVRVLEATNTATASGRAAAVPTSSPELAVVREVAL